MGSLKSIKPKTREVPIVHPETGRPVGLVFVIQSMMSSKVEAQNRRNLDERLKSRKGTVTAAQIDQQAISLLVAAVSDWRWELDDTGQQADWGGSQLPCTPENVRTVLADPDAVWIRRQVDEAVSDDASFFRTEVPTT